MLVVRIFHWSAIVLKFLAKGKTLVVLIQAEHEHRIYDKEILDIFVSFKEWSHHMEDKQDLIQVIVYKNHHKISNSDNFMAKQQLKKQQAHWA